MKLYILSDLHLEFYNNYSETKRVIDKLIPSIKPGDKNVLILAGDVCNGQTVERLKEVLVVASRAYDKVLYVAGNHEGYHSSYEEVEELIEVINHSYEKVEAACIQPRSIEFGGKTFHLCTLFFQERDPLDYFHYTRGMNDSVAIKTPLNEIQRYGRYAYDYMHKNIRKGDIVITHHLPLARSVPKEFWGANTNKFYINDCMAPIIDGEPTLWVHGHTHSVCDYEFQGTRVVCNAYGYPGQDTGYKPLIIKV